MSCGIRLAFQPTNVAVQIGKVRQAMEDEKLTDISMKGAPACGRCHMLVARYAPQVDASTGTYHRECFEAWYFGIESGKSRYTPPGR